MWPADGMPLPPVTDGDFSVNTGALFDIDGGDFPAL
jgi:hypothetical protein